MNHTRQITIKYALLSEKWYRHKEAFDDYMTKYRNLRKKVVRDTNAYWHLYRYHSSLFDEWIHTHDPMMEKKLQLKMDKIANKMVLVKKSNEVLQFQLDIYDCYTDIHVVGINTYMSKIMSLYRIQKHCKIQQMTKTKIQQLQREDCCICLNQHKLTDITTTCCGHTFGKSCFERIIRKTSSSETLSCPLCRSSISSFTVYRKKNKK